jgi:hypothetical protein
MGIVYVNKGLEKPMGRIPPHGGNGIPFWVMWLTVFFGLAGLIVTMCLMCYNMRYQPFEVIAGHEIVRNAAQLNALKRKHYMTQDKSTPHDYPAIVRILIDSSEDPYLDYTTIADCEGMIEAMTQRPQVEKEEGK